ncbi:MAG: cell filamentation protein Fic, partial [Spirochaetaceae bacterium]|nr:cell filamentation protein Fic [Spirochaetaceae bacterium]
TAEFLIFTSQANEDRIEVRVEDENVWLTQKLIAKLFDVHVATINEHLKNIFNSSELEDNSVIRKFLITANDGKKYNTKHYNPESVIESVNIELEGIKTGGLQ